MEMAADPYIRIPGDAPPACSHLGIDLHEVCRAEGSVSLGYLGEFSGLEEIGRGAFGIVYKAVRRHAKPDDQMRSVVIKHTSTRSLDLTGPPLEHEVLDELSESVALLPCWVQLCA